MSSLEAAAAIVMMEEVAATYAEFCRTHRSYNDMFVAYSHMQTARSSIEREDWETALSALRIVRTEIGIR